MKKSYLIASVLAIGSMSWMASGLMGKDEPAPDVATPSAEQATPPAERTSPLTRVRVAEFEAVPMQRAVVVNGATEAKRTLTLTAQSAGRVASITVPRGASVDAGDVIMRLDDDGREQRVVQAEALLRQRELEYEASRSLKAQGLRAESQLAESLTQLETARADLQAARLDRDRATITAPFDGVVEERLVEIGSWLQVGNPITEMIDLDPIRVSGELAELELGEVEVGMPTQVRLSDGTVFEAEVTYLASAAEKSTRTYRIEAEAANPDGRYPAGMSAEMRIALAMTPAHAISPALLSLSDEGVIGVKGVDSDGRVRFYPIELLRSDSRHIWVSGLPQQANLIIVGQGFVRDGDLVEAVTDGGTS